MYKNLSLLPVILIGLTLSLTACKKPNAANTAAAPVPAVAATPAQAEQSAPAAPAPATPPQGQPAPDAVTFNPDSVAVVAKAPPPFPYLGWPEALPTNAALERDSDFDQVYVIAGTQLRAVEGRVNRRSYALGNAKLSKFAAERNYEAAMKQMGATLINKVQPSDPAFKEAHKDLEVDTVGRLGITNTSGKYSSYLLRTPETNIWFVVSIDELNVSVVAIEEKPMAQAVKPLTAAAMHSALSESGHVALYLHFDTDKAVIRDEDNPTIKEVYQLLSSHPALNLLIEGHTDNSGDSARNKILSEQRAGAVRDALVVLGIEKLRLAAVGLADTRPLAANTDEGGRAKNRRVELVKRS
jgi:outer membrane protein OmpA-like peptidoglycan-associated protein